MRKVVGSHLSIFIFYFLFCFSNMTYIHQYYTTILNLLCYPAITSTAYHSGHAITTVTVVSNQGIDTACAAILATGLVKTWGTGGGGDSSCVSHELWHVADITVENGGFVALRALHVEFGNVLACFSFRGV